MTIVPGDRDRVSPVFSHDATISGIAFPLNAIPLLEALGFGGVHITPPLTWVSHNFTGEPVNGCALH
jgi:hypothetical protein